MLRFTSVSMVVSGSASIAAVITQCAGSSPILIAKPPAIVGLSLPRRFAWAIADSLISKSLHHCAAF